MKVQRMKGRNKISYFVYLPWKVINEWELDKGDNLEWKFDKDKDCIILSKKSIIQEEKEEVKFPWDTEITM